METTRATRKRTRVNSTTQRSPRHKPEAPSITRARVYFGRGKHDEALQELESGLADDPDNAELLWRMALIHARKGDVESALSHLDRSDEAQPSLNSLCLRINLLTAASDVKGIESAFDKYEPQFGGQREFELLRANIEISLLGALESGEKRLKHHLATHPEDGDFYQALVPAIAARERFDELIELCETALAHNADSPYIRYQLAAAYATVGRVDDALNIANALAPLAHEGAIDVAWLLGRVFEQAGNSTEALKYYKLGESFWQGEEPSPITEKIAHLEGTP